MKNQQKKSRAFSRRAFILGGIKGGLFSLLVARFSVLQLMSNQQYQDLADNNSSKIILIHPLRGMIIDRNGIILADNNFYYNIVLNKFYKSRAIEIIKMVEDILGYKTQISQIGIKKSIILSGSNNYVLVHNNISKKDVISIETAVNLNGVEIVKNLRRNYEYGQTAAHITGYISKPTAQEVSESEIKHYQEFFIGKNGIEKQLNLQLLGSPGAKKIEVNASGQFIQELDSTPPTRGSDIQLSIDIRLQKIAEKNLSKYSGSVVVLDIPSGKVLALHSLPSYDPNQFSTGVRYDYWNKVINDPDKPLINRAISTPYPPGSIFKLVVGLAILKYGININKTVFCTGEHSLGNKVFRCWKKGGHGLVDFKAAIARSCNIYFYTYGLIAGIDLINDIAIKLGMGEKTGVELPLENSGFLPIKTWRRSKLSSWSPGDLINTTIGQGYILCTPIQLALANARIASGHKIAPTIIDANNTSPLKLDIDDGHLELLRDGLYRVFNDPYGTGFEKRIKAPGYLLCGKTGTAQVKSQLVRNEKMDHYLKDHSIFCGYLPADNPKYSICVIAEHGGWGSQTALPIGISIINEFFCI